MVRPTGRPPGRPPKPAEEKRRIGNPGRRPLPDQATLTILPAATEPPVPMRPLGVIGRELWDRVWSAGAVWLAARVDAETLLIVCEQADERQQLRGSVLRNGDWRDRSQLRVLDAQMVNGLALLGFNPVDRARLSIAEVEPSALDSFMARRQQRSS